MRELITDKNGIVVDGWLAEVHRNADLIEDLVTKQAIAAMKAGPTLLESDAEFALRQEKKYGYKQLAKAKALDALFATTEPPVHPVLQQRKGYPHYNFYKQYAAVFGEGYKEVLLVSGVHPETLSIGDRVRRCAVGRSPFARMMLWAGVYIEPAGSPDDGFLVPDRNNVDEFMEALEPIVYAAKPQLVHSEVYIGDRKILPV